MIIFQIRGTSGTGKTWAARAVKKHFDLNSPLFTEGRKKPLWYEGSAEGMLMGHYEGTGCGGCDNIGSAKAVYETIQKYQGLYNHNESAWLVCEGLLLSEDTKWTLQLIEDGHTVVPMFLNTTIEKAIEQIYQRRALVGNDKPLNESNTRNRVKTIERAAKKLTAAGVPVISLRNDQVAGYIQLYLNRAGL